MLTFATDSDEECDRWMKAFRSGSSIEVQPVNTVEEIRITDLDMQRRWTSVGKSETLHTTASEVFMHCMQSRHGVYVYACVCVYT